MRNALMRRGRDATENVNLKTLLSVKSLHYPCWHFPTGFLLLDGEYSTQEGKHSNSLNIKSDDADFLSISIREFYSCVSNIVGLVYNLLC